MSTSSKPGSSEFEIDLDLHFLPAWAQKPAEENKYAQYEYQEKDRPRKGDRSDRRPPRRDRPERRDGPRPPRSGPGPERRGDFGKPRGPGRPHREARPAPPPLPAHIQATIIPEEKGVESLAKQIRLTGRAYPLFDIGFLVLKKPERYQVRLTVSKETEGTPAQPLYLCELDQTVWITEEEAVEHVLAKHFDTFYQAERTPTDPPKGTYTFVAQCGISGTVLGPPNYHDYQNKLRKLHAERFSRMPFEAYKAKIKIVRDEAIVKKWVEEQSWKTEYVGLNVPDSVRLSSREEVEKHFRETHLGNVVKAVEAHLLGGKEALGLFCRPLQNLVRKTWEEQSRFPLKVVNILSQQFAGHGLQFFKVNKTVTHVAIARPRFLDVEATPVSEGVMKIVDFIKAAPDCSRRKLLEAIAPAAAPPAAAPPSSETPAEAAPASPEAAAAVSDLHWLIHQGHVIEFANGRLELAKKPLPRPPKPAEASTEAAATSDEAAADPEAETTPASDSAPASSEPAPSVEATEPDAAPPEAASAPSEAPPSNPAPRTEPPGDEGSPAPDQPRPTNA